MIPHIANSIPRASRKSRKQATPVSQRRLNLEILEERITPTLGFGFGVGGDTSGNCGAEAIATDASGNVYVAGFFGGAVHFGDVTLNAQGLTDGFVVKYSPAGSVDWADDFGGPNAYVGSAAIAVDSSGNVYTTGVFEGADVNFDPNSSNHQLSSAGGPNAFVSKLDSSGHYSFGVALGSGGFADGSGIAVDSSGDVYTTGQFAGTNVSFDPASNVNHQLSSSNSGNDVDAYVSMLDPSGQYVFGLELGNGGNAQGNAICVDSSDNVYTTGEFSGSNLDFDPNSSNHQLSDPGTSDIAYVSKLNRFGDFVFAAVLGTGGSADGNGIAVDGAGNVYTTGQFSGSNVNFDPNSSNHQLKSSANGADNDAFVSKLNSSGQYVFAAELGSGGTAIGTGIALDGSGNVYTTGYFLGSNVSFDPNGADGQLSSSGSDNSYVSMLNSSGQYGFAVALGTGASGGSFASGIAVDQSGDVYSTGYFEGTGNFNPFGTDNLTSSTTGESIYVSKLTQAPAYQSQYAASAYGYTYWAYVFAYDAYATGKGSYAAFYDLYYADAYAAYAEMYASQSNQYAAQYWAYYAYYYGYLGEIAAYDDYVTSGGASAYSFDAYYYAYYGSTYSYYTALGY